ncbi:hypothetical protein GLA29479_4318 [Lysobacter antibioticus]|nr:hypothetical protein GLA29479_4318 [Lysobacter antibioticus]
MSADGTIAESCEVAGADAVITVGAAQAATKGHAEGAPPASMIEASNYRGVGAARAATA